MKHFRLTHKQSIWYNAVFILIVAGLLFIALPQAKNFNASWRSLTNAEGGYVALGIVAALTAPLLGGLLYKLLAPKPLPLYEVTAVQLSGLLVNRVVPAGVGGLGLNVWYLIQRKHSSAQAALIAGLNNLLGFIGHNILFVLFVVVFSASVDWAGVTARYNQLFAILCAAALLVMFTAFIFRQRTAKLLKPLRESVGQLKKYFARHPRRLPYALITSMGLTLVSVASFWACCQALNITLSFSTAFFIYSFGVLIGTATPTPGGLGGVEAALYAGLLTQHVTPETALAATLLFRLVTYWLGLVIGAIATFYLRTRIARL